MRRPSTVPSPFDALAAGVLLTSLGGAFGASARWSLSAAFPAPTGHFPWTTFLINVGGSGALATLPGLSGVRTRPWLGLLLGTGAIGGFTTMSAASSETFSLLDRGQTSLALAYCLGTLAAALIAVSVAEARTNRHRHTGSGTPGPGGEGQ